MEKNRVKVIINNTEYKLVTPEEPEYVQRVAILVDRKIAEITENNPHLSTAMISLLAAINISDDYLKLEADMDNLRKQITEYSKNQSLLSAKLAEKTATAERQEKEIQDLKIELARSGR